MLALIQRVSSARVQVAGNTLGEIGPGLLVFLGVEKNDARDNADKLLNKVLSYRVFEDAEGRMNLSVADTHGGLLLVPQFTLSADTTRGLRPSFSSAKPPAEAETLYRYFLAQALQNHDPVACGEFGADMQVSLVNDGPVTFLLKNP